MFYAHSCSQVSFKSIFYEDEDDGQWCMTLTGPLYVHSAAYLLRDYHTYYKESIILRGFISIHIFIGLTYSNIKQHIDNRQTMPCGSNDNRYTNDSNDINLSNTDETGSGCNDEVTTTIDATVIKQEIEEDTSPTDDVDTFLSCRSNNAQDLIDAKDVKQLDLKYDYEIHTTNDSNLDLLVNKFESDLLKEIGEKYGLTACEFSRVEGVLRGVGLWCCYF